MTLALESSAKSGLPACGLDPVDQFRGHVEARCPAQFVQQRGDGRNQSFAPGFDQDAEQSERFQVEAGGDVAPPALVDQQEIGFVFYGEGNGLGFARIEFETQGGDQIESSGGMTFDPGQALNFGGAGFAGPGFGISRYTASGIQSVP